MKRELGQLQNATFDVVIIGGGIYGATAAWDAALRGFSVALVEKGDFGGATSSNSLKIIHGGLRYLQHADFKRMRESISERRTLMKIAPHLVFPLPCVMPTHGHALKGKQVMGIALLLNDLIGFDRNGLSDPEKFMPGGRVISKREIREIIPGINETGLTGGAIWYDCQVRNSERLLMSFLHGAVENGAVIANYVEATGFDLENNQVKGVHVRDQFTAESFKISARLVINNAGPWLNDVLGLLNGHRPKRTVKLSAAMNLVVKKKLFDKYAVGISSKTDFKDEDAFISKGSRLFFVTPWKNYSLIGTTHVDYHGGPEDFRITEKDIADFLRDVNDAYPPAELTREDVAFYYGGLLPMDKVNERTGDVTLLKSYQIIDHARQGGLQGLLSVVSVKYTTARDVAEKTIDQACRKLGSSAKCQTRQTPVFGGQIENLQKYISDGVSRQSDVLSQPVVQHLITNYGSEYDRVVLYGEQEASGYEPVHKASPVLKAEIVHAVRDEMAMKLADVVRRRTELGSGECPADDALRTSAELMQAELSWDNDRLDKEIAEVKAIYVPES